MKKNVKRLSLKRETVRKLETTDESKAAGGTWPSATSCMNSWDMYCFTDGQAQGCSGQGLEQCAL